VRAAISRRGFLGLAGVAAGSAAAGVAVGASGGENAHGAQPDIVDFHGERQAGIITPAQDRLHIAAFDVVDGTTRADLAELLKTWTQAARRMTAGGAVGDVAGNPLAPPTDTGEALDLPAARLTVTFGLGGSLFEHEGRDRFGLRAQLPTALQPLGPLPGDELDPDRSHGDLCVQACADDPQVAFHAVRNLARLGRGTVVMRWSQLGFGRTSKTTAAQLTPRNLMGFKDGTNNITADQSEALARHVWVGREGPAWLQGGSYMVTRRIRMLIEVWDRAPLGDQEATIGRHKVSGAPLGHSAEHDPLDLAAKGQAGAPLIPADAHVRLAAPVSNAGVRILRRGYSFTDGFDPELGQLDAGLFFIAFQRDAHRQFSVLQQRLGSSDALNEYIKHVSSGLFAVPPGTRPGEFVAQRLFSA
jgi:deferrochelatase/peroxidase EfeB